MDTFSGYELGRIAKWSADRPGKQIDQAALDATPMDSNARYAHYLALRADGFDVFMIPPFEIYTPVVRSADPEKVKEFNANPNGPLWDDPDVTRKPSTIQYTWEHFYRDNSPNVFEAQGLKLNRIYNRDSWEAMFSARFRMIIYEALQYKKDLEDNHQRYRVKHPNAAANMTQHYKIQAYRTSDLGKLEFYYAKLDAARRLLL